MNEETIVAVFDSAAAADAATRDIEAAGIPSSAISRHTDQTGPAAGGAIRSTTEVASGGAGGMPRERGFWSSLFGGEPEHDTALYDRSMQGGGVVLTIKAAAERADQVMEILERHNPVDLNERASSYGLATPGLNAGARPGMTPGMNPGMNPGMTSGLTTGATAAGAATTTSGGTTGATGAGTRGPGVTGDGRVASASRADGEGGRLELAEETLSVGKRAVNRGTTRVHRFVVETPVEEQVTLRDEKVTIDRRPVADGRSASAADFSDKVVEVTETGEEAVVSKTARVREEVLIGKTATERTETVRDTVRREDVKIENGAGRAAGTPSMPRAGAAAPPAAPHPAPR